MLEIESRASSMLAKLSTTELHPQPLDNLILQHTVIQKFALQENIFKYPKACEKVFNFIRH